MSKGVARRLEVGEHEEDAEQQIRCGEDEVGAARASLQYQHGDSDAVAEFFKHRRQHQRAIARGVRGDEEKGELPGQRQADEAVKRMRDG